MCVLRSDTHAVSSARVWHPTSGLSKVHLQ